MDRSSRSWAWVWPRVAALVLRALVLLPLLGTVHGQRQPAAGASAKAADPQAPQLRALLAIKAAVDRSGALKDWTADLGEGGGFCANFPGVTCDGDGAFVEEVTLVGDDFSAPPGGGLPPAAALRALPKLRALHLQGLGLSGALPADWGGVGQLEEVVVTGNPKVTGPIPKEWGALARLHTLHLSSNGLSGSLPAVAWPLMEDLDLSGNKLSGPIPREWAKMARLNVVTLNNNQLAGALSPELGAAWKEVHHLDLAGNALSGGLPKEWAAMKKLEALHLENNQLSGPLPAEWSQIVGRATIVSLSNNKLAGALPDAWGTAARTHPVIDVDLHTNQLKGPVPASWGAKGASSVVAQLFNNTGLTGCLPKGMFVSGSPKRAAAAARPTPPFKIDAASCAGTGLKCAAC